MTTSHRPINVAVLYDYQGVARAEAVYCRASDNANAFIGGFSAVGKGRRRATTFDEEDFIAFVDHQPDRRCPVAGDHGQASCAICSGLKLTWTEEEEDTHSAISTSLSIFSLSLNAIA